MTYNTDEFAWEATALHGAAALTELLENIGRTEEQGGGDKAVAKVLVENEMPLRALLTFSLRQFAKKL